MKDILLKVAVGIMLINGLGQLALSQVHILAITKLFANQIGVYLFLFVIFGLTASFNAFSLEKRRSIILFTVSSWLTAGIGYIYLSLMQTDVAAQGALTMADVRSSSMLVGISIAIYLVGSLVIPWLSWGNVKENQF